MTGMTKYLMTGMTIYLMKGMTIYISNERYKYISNERHGSISYVKINYNKNDCNTRSHDSLNYWLNYGNKLV